MVTTLEAASPRRMAALDRPALGLALQLAALTSLPPRASAFAAVALASSRQGPRSSGVLLLALVATGLQFAAGVAIAQRSWARRVFVLYSVVALAVALVAASAIWADTSTVAFNADLLEICAPPLMILLAPLVIDVGRFPDRRSPADAAAALLVFPVGTAFAGLVGLAFQLRIAPARFGVGAVLLGAGVVWGLTAAIAAVAWLAGRALLQAGPPAVAHQKLRRYLLVALVAGVGSVVLQLLATLGAGLGGRSAYLLFVHGVGLLLAVVRPLAIWAYARPLLREPITVERREMSGPLVWPVLWFVPILFVHSFLLSDVPPATGGAATALLCALLCAQAISNLLAVRAASRTPDRGFRAAAAAATIAAVLLVSLVAWMSTAIDSQRSLALANSSLIFPVILTFVMLSTLAASLRGTAPVPGLPRATAMPE
jgi:hypothetical protein